MQVFKLYFQILRRNLPLLGFYLLFTLLFVFISSQALAKKDKQELTYRAYPIYVLDEDQTPLSQALVKSYRENTRWVDLSEVQAADLATAAGNITTAAEGQATAAEDQKMAAEGQKTAAEGSQAGAVSPAQEKAILDAIFANRLDAVLIIPQGFQQNFEGGKPLKVLYYGTENDMERKQLERQGQAIMMNLSVFQMVCGGKLEGKNVSFALDKVGEIVKPEKLGSLLHDDQAQNRYEAYLLTAFNFIDYTILLMGFAALGLAITAIERKEIKDRTLVSGYPEIKTGSQVLLASILTMILVWMVNVALIYLFFVVGHESILETPVFWWALASNFMNLLASTSMILFFIYLIPSPQASAFLKTILPLLIAFGTGVFVPRRFLSPLFLKAMVWAPSYWDTKVSAMVTSKMAFTATEQAAYQTSILVMAGMAVGYFVLMLALRFYRRQGAGLATK